MKILHFITSLDLGGAEKTLVRIVNKSNFNHAIITILNSHKLKQYVRKDTVIISILPFSLKRILRIFDFIKKYDPDVLQGWMYHGDLLASIFGFVFKKKVFWNIRHGKMSLKFSSKKTLLLRFFLSIISHFSPKKIISCSNCGVFVHQKIGYTNKKFVVIHNGIKLENNLIKDYRDISKKDIIKIGSIGRNNPQKNRKYFIDIVCKLNKFRRIESLIYGRGITNSLSLRNLISKKKYNIQLYESKNNINDILSQLDILLVTSTYGEGCPNVIIEAMKFGIIVMSTDVGDSKYIINNKRLILPNKNSAKSFYKIKKIIEAKDLNNIILDCKNRANKLFSEENMIKKYEDIWATTL